MHRYINMLLFLALMAGVTIVAYPSKSLLHSSETVLKDDQNLPEDIAFLQGLIQIDKGRTGDPPEKYFHESYFNSHYDGRFAKSELPSQTRIPHLRALIRSYLTTMHELGAETWIMHGSLLGWWWNRRIMPWDDDLDVQVSEAAIEFLASYHNMTIHSFAAGDLTINPDDETLMQGRKRYLLEVNPHYVNPSTDDRENVIDARWIDTDTGLFIDITAVRVDKATEAEKGKSGEFRFKGATYRHSDPPQRLYCKDEHSFLSTQIFPLRLSVFEGVPVHVPFSYQELLVEEYGQEALVQKEFWEERHYFDQAKGEWIPMSKEMLKNREKEGEWGRLDKSSGLSEELKEWKAQIKDEDSGSEDSGGFRQVEIVLPASK
ncbi:unnamed protein product [Periconia digitata]|uniref:LicD/FKTN/FKRP nucleotidyltransferase domain-containing protein n=1 Tax=Periconia digitata TaxID=1303443 RepID=A0A9W4UE23_9PLEO|nr:unnamed protein product [Periconia digitata]